jgi:cellulose synthase/poly-beta-1,6-N-acetylglucosamine synthase-like glycosyltransferase
MSATPDTSPGELAVESLPAGSTSAQALRVLRLVDPLPPEPARAPEGELRLSVIVPATDSPPTLERCLAAIENAHDPPAELVIIEHPAGASPASARNRGAQMATGDVLVFVDADVEVHADVFRRIRTMLAEERGATALFGSYDDEPSCDGVVSQFRNLLHHHVHQSSPGTIGTFWAGLGAIRRDAFLAAGGFIDHPLEDVELGMRLSSEGRSILLDPRVQGKHLKRWTVWSMVRTDLLVRGAPWIGLAMRHRDSAAVLNIGWRHRISAAASLWAVAGMVRRRVRPALAATSLFLALNRSFYMLLLRRQGPRGAVAGIGLHFLHHLTGVAAVPTGIVLYIRQRHAGSR